MVGFIIEQEGVLFGSMSSVGNLSGTINSEESLTGRIVITTDRECYTGNCHVIPKIDSQVLPTCDKVINQDITVEGIPFYEVSNQQGGTTFIIGGN